MQIHEKQSYYRASGCPPHISLPIYVQNQTAKVIFANGIQHKVDLIRYIPLLLHICLITLTELPFSKKDIKFSVNTLKWLNTFTPLCMIHFSPKKHIWAPYIINPLIVSCQHILIFNIESPTKVCRVKSMVFVVVMYGCESWAIKKAEHRRIGAFELWCWKRVLRVPLTARRSNQSILKEISPEYHWKDWC